MKRRLSALLVGALVALAAGSGTSFAFPDQAVTIIVPWSKGGNTDTVTRIFAEDYAKELGVPVNVVNRPGGDGMPAIAEVIEASPDGYTLGMISPEIVYYRSLGRTDLSLDDLDVFSRLAVVPAGVTVRADSPYGDLDAVLAAFREQPPGTLIASGGKLASGWHIAGVGMLKAAGIDPKRLGWVVSDGGAPAVAKLVAGDITVYTGAPAEALVFRDAGKVKVLALMAPERSPVFPGVPTLKEKGVDWTYLSFYALFAPKGVDPERRKILYDAAARAAANQDMQAKLLARGLEPVWDTQEALAAYLADVTANVEPVLADLDLSE